MTMSKIITIRLSCYLLSVRLLLQ